MRDERGRAGALSRGARGGTPRSKETGARRRRLRGTQLRLMFQFRLRTVLVVVSLFVLILPVASIQVLRLYESALLRQTESALIAQAAFISASYRAAYRNALDGAPDEAPETSPRGPRLPQLDFVDSPVYPPFPPATPGPTADPVAIRAGADIAPVLQDPQTVALASVRVIDASGVVIATTDADLGLSISQSEEAIQALAGLESSRLRGREPEQDPPPIGRGGATLVYVASPILLNDRLVGAVVLSRAPVNIFDTLYAKRYLLLQAAVLILAVVVGIALFTSRTLVMPIQRIARGAEQLASGETGEFEAQRPYRVVEIARLSDSVSAMAEHLQQRTVFLRDFAQHVSHEFKTPLTALGGTVEVLRDHLGEMTPAQREHFLGNARSDVDRLNHLTLRLLELAQADIGTGEETSDVLDVARSLDHATVRAPPSASVRATIRRESLEAALTNLVTNAREHGASRIDIRAETRGDSVEVWVEDDGPGISDGNQSRIFEPFFTTRRDDGGTGLGLSITRSLVNAAGGTIELAPAKTGAAFKITLGAADGESVPDRPKTDRSVE